MNTVEKQLTRKAETQLAANVDHLDTEQAHTQTSGWDAYEVWRRMVKEPREQRRTPKN